MGSSIPAELEALRVPVADLRFYGRNPRTGNVAAIVSSLRKHGQYRPVVVNRRTSEVLAGNHTLKAALQLGWTEIAATYVDVDDEAAARIVLVDNRSNDLAVYDDSALLELLADLPDLDGTGFAAGDVADLERKLAALTSGDLDYSKEWDEAGMPGYEDEDLGGAYRTVVHFKTDADADAFFAEIGRPKLKRMWWPEPDGFVGLLSGSRVSAESD